MRRKRTRGESKQDKLRKEDKDEGEKERKKQIRRERKEGRAI